MKNGKQCVHVCVNYLVDCGRRHKIKKHRNCNWMEIGNIWQRCWERRKTNERSNSGLDFQFNHQFFITLSLINMLDVSEHISITTSRSYLLFPAPAAVDNQYISNLNFGMLLVW